MIGKATEQGKQSLKKQLDKIKGFEGIKEMVKAENKKVNQPTPKKIRSEIITLIQNFQHQTRGIIFEIPKTANLKTIINGSSSLKKIRWITKQISE
jgi:hypothetical protein